MQVDCNIAKTKVVQTFTNHGGTSIPEAWYSFPLYDGAAVTAFRCEVGDDKVLEGMVKPKDEAKREFKRAVKKQEAAALIEEMAPDVFQTTIGNIRPRTTVKVEITYVEELHTDLSGDGIVVTIPTSVAPKYGTSPAGYMTNSAVKETGISLVANISNAGLIKNVVCRSGHHVYFEYGKISHVPETTSFEALAQLQNQNDSGLQTHHATARLSSSQTVMDRDIVLFIPFPGEVLQNSRALLAPSSGSDHAAMMVTVRPSELFPDLRVSMDGFAGELLFLADRSGSMQGSQIAELKDALLVFLKSLPAKCRFNLYSFGNTVSSLWPLSMPYDDRTLQEALDHVSTFQADFGGTEVLRALRKAVEDRQPTDVSSTQLILLTDGEIWQSEQTIEFVRRTTSESEGQLRFFSLGIGDRVSHQLIQGIGFFGGGFGEAVPMDCHGKWKEAVIRMLKGALMPKSWSYSISLGDQWREKRLDMDSFPHRQPETISGGRYRIAGSINPSFVQAPRVIPNLHHFRQQSVFFLLDDTSGKLPDHVVITAYSQCSGVNTATLAVTNATSNTVQYLAAKAAVRDLENQDTPEAASLNQIRKNAEHLSQMYSISSKWTSFVAVSHLQQCAEYEDVEVSQYKAPLAELHLLTRPTVSQASPNFAPRAARRIQVHDTPDPSTAPLSQRISIITPPPFPKRCATGPENYPTYFEADHHRLPRVHSSSRSRPPLTKEFSELPKRRQSIIEEHDESNSVAFNHGAGAERLQEPNDGLCAVDWQELIRDQRADGLFRLGKTLEHRIIQHFCYGTRKALGRWLEQAVKGHVADAAEEVQMAELIVDTVMALAYIRSHFHLQRALWDLLVQKAEGKLASLLELGHCARPSGLAAIADSALAHAHYGRCSQVRDQSAWCAQNPGNGICGVCNSQSEEWLSAVTHDDEFGKCCVVGCDISVDKWDEFWAHAVEQGHICSSCEFARIRYKEAFAKAGGYNTSGDMQEAQEKVVPEDPEGQHGQTHSITLQRKADFADAGC